MEAPALHTRLEPLAFLLGTWRGLGVVGYPTIEEQAARGWAQRVQAVETQVLVPSA